MMPGMSGAAASPAASNVINALKQFGSSMASAGNPSAVMTIGTAATNRYVVVAVGNVLTFGTAAAPTSVTVGGQACTKVADISQGGSAQPRTTLWITNAPVTTGTTATVSATASGSCGMATWAIYGIASTTPYATATVAGSPSSTTIDFQEGGVAIGAVATNSSPGAQTFTGLTKDFDGSLNSAKRFSGASLSDMSAGTGQTVSNSPTNNNAFAVACWAPA